MADNKKEWISALADGELQAGELDKALTALQQDSELQASWRRYHLIHDALHSNLESTAGVDLHKRVSAALEDEPVIFAPQRQRRSHPWVKQVVGLAVAASVSGVAVIGFQQMNVADSGESATNMAEVAQPQNFVRIQPPPVSTVAMEKEESPQIPPYLFENREYSVRSGVNGMVPYVRIVGHRKTE